MDDPGVDYRLLFEASEREKRAIAADLESTSRELESLVYAVSHDLRAPLRAIDGFSQALEEDCGAALDECRPDGPDGASGRESLERVRAGVRRMTALLEDLLTLSRIGRAHIEREALDLTALTRGILAELERQHPGREVAVDVADGLSAEGDRVLVRTALSCLLDNAWKFTARTTGARIEIGRHPAPDPGPDGGDSPAFFVRDNGIGFDMSYAGRLFTPFQRFHGPDAPVGNGVGLALVQRIVRRHGGRVWAMAAVNGGAMFSFSLPPRSSPSAPL